MKYIFLFASLVALAFNSLQAQESTLKLTLEQAVDYALSHNIKMKNAAQDIRDAQAQKWATIATGLPQISGSANFQNQLEQPVAQIPAQFFGGQPGTFEEVVFGQPQILNAGLSYNQLIFDGSYVVGVQAIKTFIAYSENAYNKTSLEVRASVVEAYANALMAEKSAELLSKNVAQVERNLFESKALFENGLGEQETVDQLQITYTTLKSNEKNAYRIARISLYMLNVLLGREINEAIDLIDSLEALVGVEMVSPLTETFEFEQNVDYKMVENLTEQTALELKLAKSRALPTLSASLNLGANAFGERFDFFETGKEYFNTAILGVNLQVPIFSSLLRSANTQRAKIADIKAQNTKKDTERMLSVQFENLSSAFALSKEQFLSAKDNLDLAQRIADKNELKFKEGIASSFDLRQAQLQLYQSQQEYLSSMVRVINTHTQLANFLNESL
jgi:outer membrane protein TolC